jgi:hypothetical protein
MRVANAARLRHARGEMNNRYIQSIGALFLAAFAFCVPLGGIAQTSNSASPPAPEAVKPPTRVIGILVKVNPDSLVLTRALNNETNQVNVPLPPNPEVRMDGETRSIADLQPGTQVSVISFPPTETRPGRAVVVALSKGISGTVVKVEGENVILRQAGPGAKPGEITVHTDTNTHVRVLGAFVPGNMSGPRNGTLADLKPGMRVKVIPETGTAARIVVNPMPGTPEFPVRRPAKKAKTE